MLHAWERLEIHTEFWLENLRERDHLDDLGLDGKTVLLQILEKSFGKVWTGFMWLRVG
jgi:hypothetical protein